ncbi:hypothetical protein BJX63DRAFT_86550 [Aspergillus granulosus]|uniref:Kinesin light chain n=1 Tax=Aspergillus granulosus TaxID=176169 RepID=A0ABR4GVH7_9EURO
MKRQALEGYKKVLGLEHPNTLTCMHSLAFTLKELGKTSDALSLIKECANLRKKVLGSDNPHAISSFNALSKWETAENQLLECQNQQASADTPSTLPPMHTYAGDYTASDLKPTGRKRRVFMDFFRRR